MSKCEFHDEVFKNIGESLKRIETKVDKLGDTNVELRYLKEDFKNHKNNVVIHISKWWVFISIATAVVGIFAGLKL